MPGRTACMRTGSSSTVTATATRMGMMLTRSGDRQLRHESCAARLQKLPQFLQALVELLLAAGVYPLEQAPQHVLINSYGKAAGISPHMDGPLYSPCVATITLGGPALMAFHEVQPDGTQGQLATEVLTTILATACFLTCIYYLV